MPETLSDEALAITGMDCMVMLGYARLDTEVLPWGGRMGLVDTMLTMSWGIVAIVFWGRVFLKGREVEMFVVMGLEVSPA